MAAFTPTTCDDSTWEPAMTELVLFHHEEPMTTSPAVSEGVGMEHASILKLIRNHVDSLAEFGGVGFEIQPFDTSGGKQWRGRPRKAKPEMQAAGG